MKSRLMVVFAAAGLLVIPALANAQDTMQAPQAQQQNPTAPAASSDMTSQSYGGTTYTTTQSGGRRAAENCRVDPRCNIFFGN
ncbi:hypothetical protein [Paraburkholderia terrae]